MDSEDLDEVIHIDHAYASHRNDFEEDPLKLPDPEAVLIKTEIKTEDVEIKIEEPESYEGENNEHLNFEPGETLFYDLDEDYDTANIEFVEHTTFEAESVPRVFYLNVEDKNETIVSTTATQLSTDKLVQENKKLKRTIARLKNEKFNCYANIESNSRKFYDDLNKMHHIQCDLQKEIQILKDENEKYQRQLVCYEKLKKHHLDLETHILELRTQAHKFMKYEKLAIANMKNMKKDMDAKSHETKDVRERLAATVKRLAYLKARLAKLVNINKMQAIKASQCAELQTRLKSAVRMNKLYDVHLKSSKTQFDKMIKEKQQAIESTKEEIDTLKKLILEKEATCNILKEKYKFSLELQKQTMLENKKQLSTVKDRLDKIKLLLSRKEVENVELQARISQLEMELTDIKNKSCDYCGL